MSNFKIGERQMVVKILESNIEQVLYFFLLAVILIYIYLTY